MRLICIVLVLCITVCGCVKPGQVSEPSVEPSDSGIEMLPDGDFDGGIELLPPDGDATPSEGDQPVLRPFAIGGSDGDDEVTMCSGLPLALRLEVDDQQLPLDYIEMSIVNEAEQSIGVVLIPTLEKFDNDGWRRVEFHDGMGFCGTPDSITQRYDGQVPLEWFGETLTEGTYRLSYNVRDYDGELCCEFVLKNP